MGYDVAEMFTPNHLFSFASDAYAKLFYPDEPVWMALERLKTFFSQEGRIEGKVSEHAYLVHPELITIEPGAVVEPGAYLEGPCFIGAGSVVRHGAYVRGYVVTGRGCVIGHATEVKHSIFLDEAKAAHFAYVGDSILGQGVNLGAGTKCANLRLDNGPVRIAGMETGRRKLGALLGDGVQLGCNCVTNPGTVMGKGASAYPCQVISGVVEEKSIIGALLHA